MSRVCGRSARAWLSLCCAWVTACSTPHRSEPKPSSPSAAPNATASSNRAPSANPAIACGSSEPGALAEPALKTLLSAWRKAQQNHDFAAYSALYGEHFSGILGDNTAAQVDRSTWLQAHRDLFESSSADSRAAPLIAFGAGGARVSFASAVAAGDKKAGQSELFVSVTSDGPRITWQAPARPATSELAAHSGLWLASEDAALLSRSPENDWAEGAPIYADENTATRAVVFTRLPKSLRAWLGRSVRVLGASGTVCETRLQRFSLRARISPSPSVAEVWEGCADQPKPPPGEIAAQIWQLAAGDGRSLVAEFSAPCKGALLAVDPDLPAPAISAPAPASAELGAAALEAFRKLPAYAEIQRQYAARNPDTEGAWEDQSGHRGLWSLALPGHPSLVFVSVEAGTGCGAFSASLSALWEVHAGDGNEATLNLLAVPSSVDGRRLTPSAAVDLEGSGATQVLLGPDGLFSIHSLLSKSGPGYRRVFLGGVPLFGGPC